MKTVLTLCFVLAFQLADAQIIKTSLTLTVRDELGNTVEGAEVKLYETEADYLAEKNPAAEAIADKKGVVKFKDIKAAAFYVLARKGDKDNAGGGEQIGKLEANKFNKATVVIQ
ncbi:MAG: hypothetical protein SH819_10580 [Cytophagales bacterium]|mgnify:CR=1 FL=1|nr:hypothetical protein [Cytophagales bacterium]